MIKAKILTPLLIASAAGLFVSTFVLGNIIVISVFWFTGMITAIIGFWASLFLPEKFFS